MATITTTTVSNPLIYPSQTQIERVRGADMYVIVAASTANTYELWRSQNGGTSWTMVLSTVRANLVELGCIQVLKAPYNQLVWCFRTYESGLDQIRVKTISDLGAGTLAWNAEYVAAYATAASAGAIYSGIDMANWTVPGQLHYIVFAVGSVLGGSNGITVFMAQGQTLATLQANNNALTGGQTGSRYWINTGSGRITPSIEIEHTGDGHSSNSPNVWVAWGRTNVYMVKGSWTGGGWAFPNSAVQLNPVTLSPAQDSISARWDGSRFVVAVPDPGSTSVVSLFERDRANSKTTIRQTPTHPQGVIRACTLGYNSVTGDIRVFAVGTSTAVLYFVDYIRATGTWSSWATVTATAILNVNNFSVRRATDGRYEVVTAHSGSPNTIVHTAQSLSYTPNVPKWDASTMQLNSGAAYDVNFPLTLDWIFSDPDPNDTQGSYAISRQIGAGALNYWRASDSTWQVAEVQNSSATSAVVLPNPWGSGTDAVTVFKAKVWDAANVPSAYGDGFAVLPSTVVNPSLTAPTSAQVLTADSVNLTWTATEQTAWRALLWQLGVADTFTSRTNTANLGTPEVGPAWSTSGGNNSDYNVGSNVATFIVASANTFRHAQVDTGSPDHTVWADLSFNVATPAGAPVTCAVVGRATDFSNYYNARLSVQTSGASVLTLVKTVAGTGSAISTAQLTLGTGHASGEVWRVVLDCQGTTIRTKAWRISGTAQAEPEWQITVVDETSLTTGNRAGTAVRADTGNTNTGTLVVTLDNFYASTALAYDTGWLNTPATSYAMPAKLADGSAWLVGLRTRNLESLASTEQHAHVTVDFVEPAQASLVATPDSPNGIISVAITNQTPVGAQPTVADQDVYARPNIAGANRLANGGFEVNTTGWGTVTAGSFVRSTAQFHSGTASGLLTPDGTSALPRAESSVSASPVTTAGMAWTFDGWLRATTANKPIRIILNWYDSGGSFISSDFYQVTPIAGAWLYLSVTAIAPTGTNKVGGGTAVANTPAVGDTLFIDDMRLRPYDGTAGSKVAGGVASGATISDWHAVSGVDYEYRVFTRAINGTSTYGPWTA